MRVFFCICIALSDVVGSIGIIHYPTWIFCICACNREGSIGIFLALPGYFHGPTWKFRLSSDLTHANGQKCVRLELFPTRTGISCEAESDRWECELRYLGLLLLKALVWFWIINETLLLTSMLSVCRLNEVGTCQVMEQVMIMVMMVMTTR